MDVQLYIQGERVELFKDENISINSTVQNVNDITKTFTDFSQSFTVPASSKNNQIFQYWYSPEIDGFDARIRIEAAIEIGFQPFRTGVVQLNNVQKKNGKAYSYDVTFFGDLVSLSDLVGDDKLTDLDLSAYEHDFDSDNVKLGLEGETLLSGDVIYPLISPVRAWQFGDASAEDIRNSTTTGGLDWFELKPAIKLTAIIDAISAKYGITLSNDFFGLDHFKKLFMWASRDKDYMRAFGEPNLLDFAGNVQFCKSTSWEEYRHQITFSPDPADLDKEYTLIMDIDGVQTKLVRTGLFVFTKVWTNVLNQGFCVKWYIQSSEPLTYSASLTVDYEEGGIPNNDFSGSTGTNSLTGRVYFTDTIVDDSLQVGQLPDMKVGDFLTGLIKAFNLAVIGESPTRFKVVQLDTWYDQGSVKEFDKYIDVETETIERPPLNSQINFNYQEPETILQVQFNALNNLFYGDLESPTPYDGDTLEVELPFENMLFSRLTEFSDGSLTNVRVGSAFDTELEPVKTKPLIFYLGGQTTPTEDIGFVGDDDIKVAVSSYNNVGQADGLTELNIENSLNWGAEVDSFTNTVIEESLFSNYWSTYIGDLYDKKRRLFKFEGWLPAHVITLLQLNDIIVINRRRYIINSYTANITTGKVEFELLNDLRAPKPIEDTSNGLEYELESPIE